MGIAVAESVLLVGDCLLLVVCAAGLADSQVA